VAAGVLQAVIDVLEADATLAAMVPGGWWREEVPPDTAALPNGVIFDDGGAADLYSELGGVETRRLHLEVYASRDPTLPGTDPARPAQAAERIVERARDVLNRGTLSVAGGEHMLLRAAPPGSVGSRAAAVERRDAQGLRVYRGTLAVFAQVGRPAPAP
jgi:hypothetical protein